MHIRSAAGMRNYSAEPHELPSVGCRAEGLLMLVQLITFWVTRQVSAHKSATAYTGKRYRQVIETTKR
jgi:hypothetical protein